MAKIVDISYLMVIKDQLNKIKNEGLDNRPNSPALSDPAYPSYLQKLKEFSNRDTLVSCYLNELKDLEDIIAQLSFSEENLDCVNEERYKEILGNLNQGDYAIIFDRYFLKLAKLINGKTPRFLLFTRSTP